MTTAARPMDDLIAWAKERGSHLAASVGIAHDPAWGWAWIAEAAIPAGSELVSVSTHTALSYLNALDVTSGLFPHHGSRAFARSHLSRLGAQCPHVVGNYFLMQQYLEAEQSLWWPYIRLLPQPDAVPNFTTPLWWPETDRVFLHGTNVHPAVQATRKLWAHDWQRGLDLVLAFDDSSAFTLRLYEWAATVFSTRSFRASLTIPPAFPRDRTECLPAEESMLRHQISQDNFSVLLPLMDIGNHCEDKLVDWRSNLASGQTTLVNLTDIECGSQIYNYYGDKSNSELLLGYGFILPNPRLDTVNIKLAPQPDALERRQRQPCFPRATGKTLEQELMFCVHPMPPSGEGSEEDGDPAAPFSAGLLDLLTCIVANERERRHMSDHGDCCLEHQPARFNAVLGRNAVETWHLLHQKLQADIKKLRVAGEVTSSPQNANQVLALHYRRRQLRVLQAAARRLSRHLDRVRLENSFGRPEPVPAHRLETAAIRPKVELASLEWAYEWLRHFSGVYETITHAIADDQAEPLPIDWALLLTDWDRSYWVIWICIVLLLREAHLLPASSPRLTAWLGSLERSYQIVLQTNHAWDCERRYDRAELEIIDSMLTIIVKEPLISSDQKTLGQIKALAFYVYQEETIFMAWEMKEGSSAGMMVDQSILCIS